MRQRSAIVWSWLRALIATWVLVAVACPPHAAHAQYFRRPVSSINPDIMLIDEKAVLGAKISPETAFVDQSGREFTWADMEGKPTILVLSYYSCDGSCSIINSTLASLLEGVTSVQPGVDFRILTVSFDRHDTIKTTDAFSKHMAIAGKYAKNWTFATFKREDELQRETQKIGFKFFWSPEDRIFLHPGAFLFFSPDGRLIRVLYQDAVDSRDIELAVLDARQGRFRPSEVIKYALSLCYSYSYKDGKYVMSIPLIVALGALAFGVATLFGSIIYFKHFHHQKPRSGENDYAQAA